MLFCKGPIPKMAPNAVVDVDIVAAVTRRSICPLTFPTLTHPSFFLFFCPKPLPNMSASVQECHHEFTYVQRDLDLTYFTKLDLTTILTPRCLSFLGLICRKTYQCTAVSPHFGQDCSFYSISLPHKDNNFSLYQVD